MTFQGNYDEDGPMQKFFNLMKRNKVQKFRYGELEVEFQQEQIVSTNTVVPQELSDMPPDDLMLFAATDEFDRMVNERKAAKEPEVE